MPDCAIAALDMSLQQLPGGKLFVTMRALWQASYRIHCFVEGFRLKVFVLVWVLFGHVSEQSSPTTIGDTTLRATMLHGGGSG